MGDYTEHAKNVLDHHVSPVIAVRMAKMEMQGHPVRGPLARLGGDNSWKSGSVSPTFLAEKVTRALTAGGGPTAPSPVAPAATASKSRSR
ncbi:hypothetical protein ABZ599_37075 [Streptomyces misionensis]|uniref:hypothetical protein n=1 Tax=Streptomyces misionensis TaxID=67331 RepID=UPI0033E57585